MQQKAEYRARNAVLSHVLRDHRNDVIILNDVWSIVKDDEHAKLLWEKIQTDNCVELLRFMLGLLFSVKAERFWRRNIYIDMCHHDTYQCKYVLSKIHDVYSSASVFKYRITTLDTDKELN